MLVLFWITYVVACRNLNYAFRSQESRANQMNNAGLCTSVRRELRELLYHCTYYSTSSGLVKLAGSKRLRRAIPRLCLRLRPCQYLQSLHPTYNVTLIRVIHENVLTRVMHDNVFENNVKSIITFACVLRAKTGK